MDNDMLEVRSSLKSLDIEIEYLVDGSGIDLRWNGNRDNSTDYNITVQKQVDYETIFEKTVKTPSCKLTLAEEYYGKSVLLRVTSTDAEGTTQVVLGSPRVCTNCNAQLSPQNSRRMVNLAWDAPEDEPSCYVISDVLSKKIFESKCLTTSTTIGYLKQGTEYCFKVEPIYDEKKGFPCWSNWVSTRTRYGSKEAGGQVNTLNIKTSGSVNFQDSSISLGTGASSSENFVQHVDFSCAKLETLGEEDVVICSWKNLHLGKYDDDYRIICFELSSHKINTAHRSNVSEVEPNHSEQKIKLELASEYEIMLAIKYEIIDEEKFETFSKITVSHTSPQKPKITRNEIVDNCIQLSWLSSHGVEEYVAEIFTKKKVVKRQKFSNSVNSWTVGLESFKEFGQKYCAKVTAYGKNKLWNYDQNYYVGLEFVPRNLKLTVEETNQTSIINIAWNAPKNMEDFDHYEIKVEEKYGNCSPMEFLLDISDDKFQVTKLKTGVKYKIMLSAIYNTMANPQTIWDEIVTLSSPATVANLCMTNVKDPSTMIAVKWDGDNNSSYKIIVTSNNKQVILDNHEKSSILIDQLVPATKYTIEVAPKNAFGYGQCSSVETCTEPGEARNLTLSVIEKMTIKVSFEAAFGKPSKYIISLSGSGNSVKTQSIYCGDYTTSKYEAVFQKLRENTKYFAKVRTFYGEKESNNIVSLAMMTGPPKPKNVSVVEECGIVTIKWDSLIGINKYVVQIKKENSNEIIKKFNVNECKLVYRNEVSSALYVVKVGADNETGFINWSKSKMFRLKPAPVKKLKLIESMKDREIKVVWCGASETTAFGFSIKVFILDVEGGNEFKLCSTASSPNLNEYAFRGQASTKYKVEVCEVNESGNGPSKFKELLTAPGKVNKIESRSCLTGLLVKWGAQRYAIAYKLSFKIIDDSNENEKIMWKEHEDYPSILYETQKFGGKFHVGIQCWNGTKFGPWSDDIVVSMENPSPVKINQITQTDIAETSSNAQSNLESDAVPLNSTKPPKQSKLSDVKSAASSSNSGFNSHIDEANADTMVNQATSVAIDHTKTREGPNVHHNYYVSKDLHVHHNYNNQNSSQNNRE